MIIFQKKIKNQLINKEMIWYIQNGKEFIQDIVYEISWKESTDIKTLENENVSIKIDYYFFYREIHCKKLKQVRKEKVKDLFIVRKNSHLMFKKNYYRITKQNIIIKQNVQDKPIYDLINYFKQVKTEYEFDLYICFDLETCAKENDKHFCYLGYFKIYKKDIFLEDKLIVYDGEDFNFLFKFGIFFGEILDKYVYNEELRHFHICLFGFNSFRFDNHFIYDFFIKNNYDCQYLERFGKTTKSIFKHNFLSVHLCDLIIWLPECSLSKALEEYECDHKDDLNIVIFNDFFKEKNYDWEYMTKVDKKEFEKCFKISNSFKFKKMVELKGYVKNNKYNLWQAVIDYCKQDVDASFQLFQKISTSFNVACENFNFLPSKEILYYISPSHVSGHILNYNLNNQTKKIFFIHEDWFEFLKSTYFGGRVDFGFIGEFNFDEIFYEDVTSMYSLAMTAYYPVVYSKEDILIDANVDYLQQLVNQNKCFDILFVAECKIELPENLTNLCSFGPIPYRDRESNKLYFPNKECDSRILNSIQIATLLLSKYKITILNNNLNTIFLKKDLIFKDLVLNIGKLKTEAKLTNKALGKLYKLFLNSFYGKLAQKTDTKQYFFNGKISLRYDEKNFKKSNVHYASFVASYANWILFSTFYKIQKPYIDMNVPIEARCGSLLYCDTDSIVFTDNFRTMNSFFNHSDELGYFDIEKMDFYTTWKRKYSNCKSLIVLGKKSYFVLDENKKFLDVKLKGIHTTQFAQFLYPRVKEIIHNYFNNITISNISFSGLLRKSSTINCVSNTSSFFIKEIYNTDLKKTLSVNVPKYKKKINFDSTINEKVLTLNLNFINQNYYNDIIKHYLVFYC